MPSTSGGDRRSFPFALAMKHFTPRHVLLFCVRASQDRVSGELMPGALQPLSDPIYLIRSVNVAIVLSQA